MGKREERATRPATVSVVRVDVPAKATFMCCCRVEASTSEGGYSGHSASISVGLSVVEAQCLADSLLRAAARVSG